MSSLFQSKLIKQSRRILNANLSQLLRAFWILITSLSILYFLAVYLFPLALNYVPPLIPTKNLIDYTITSVSLAVGLSLAFLSFFDEPQISFENEILIVRMGNHIIATCCLQLSSVSGSVILDANGRPKYSTAFLHAIRNGLNNQTTISYEVGVLNNEPHIRLFITSTGTDLLNLREKLKREATRVETILIATLRSVELTQVRGESLQEAVMFNSKGLFSNILKTKHEETELHTQLLVLQGIPSTLPNHDISQIGTFISTAVKKGYSIRFNCTISRTNPSRRKRNLESKWKSIRNREMRKEDTLEDQATKKRLVNEYEEIEEDAAWFHTSAYLVIESQKKAELNRITDSVIGLVLSLWGGDGSISIGHKHLSKRSFLRLISRRHIKSQALHVNRVVAFINTPVQKLPVLTPIEAPDFNIPPKELVENELTVGHVVFGGRRIGLVGLKPEWLRQHVAVLGATGTGKTTLVKHLMSQLSQKTNVPWWVFDVKGSEYLDLIPYSSTDILVIRPGLDSSFVISLIDPDFDNQTGHSTFVLLKELLKERSSASELSPAMEKLLKDAIVRMIESTSNDYSVAMLRQAIEELTDDDGLGKLTRDGLLNRLEILAQEPLSSILAGGEKTVTISKLINRRVIFDLRYVAQTGGMEAARILYNLIAKRIFDCAMKRGIKSGIHHIVVLEEASNLVPQSYTKLSAADVTTGESMVLLQRATGQGVIVVSTRPNISSDILANTSTKFAFRLPYDSTTGARFMSLDDSQESYLRTLKRGRALALLPNFGSFEIATDPFKPSLFTEDELNHELHKKPGELSSQLDSTDNLEESSNDDVKEMVEGSDRATILDRIGEIANHVIAHLASKNIASYAEIRSLLSTLVPNINNQDMEEVVSDLVSLETIERESLSLIEGGFLFTLPGRGLEAVKEAIVSYIVEIITPVHDVQVPPNCPRGIDLVIDDRAVLILPEHVNTTSLSSTLEKIREVMIDIGNIFIELVVVIRGSVAAAKLRESMSKSADFDAVTVVPAFPSSIAKFSQEILQNETQKHEFSESGESSEPMSIIGSVHDIGSATNREIQMRLWFNLIQDFIEISKGRIEWKDLLTFITTTAMQSVQGRSTPLNEEEGTRALAELLADEVIIAIRLGNNHNLFNMEPGLWIVNPTTLQSIKESTTGELEKRLLQQQNNVIMNHSYYDLCAGKKSYVIFPTQQELNTLLHLHSNIACRTCKTTEVICLLTAEEYIDDNMRIPDNYRILTMEKGIAAVPI